MVNQKVTKAIKFKIEDGDGLINFCVKRELARWTTPAYEFPDSQLLSATPADYP